jgi:hypothetical protein
MRSKEILMYIELQVWQFFAILVDEAVVDAGLAVDVALVDEAFVGVGGFSVLTPAA